MIGSSDFLTELKPYPAYRDSGLPRCRGSAGVLGSKASPLFVPCPQWGNPINSRPSELEWGDRLVDSRGFGKAHWPLRFQGCKRDNKTGLPELRNFSSTTKQHRYIYPSTNRPSWNNDCAGLRESGVQTTCSEP